LLLDWSTGHELNGTQRVWTQTVNHRPMPTDEWGQCESRYVLPDNSLQGGYLGHCGVLAIGSVESELEVSARSACLASAPLVSAIKAGCRQRLGVLVYLRCLSGIVRNFYVGSSISGLLPESLNCA
jgi:hypothetical protein